MPFFWYWQIVGMWMCIYNSLDWPFSRLPVIEVKTLGHGFFRDERGNDHDAFPSFNNSYVRKTSAVNLVNSFCDFRQRVFGIGTGNAPRNRFVPGALFRILNTLTVILIRIVNSGRFLLSSTGCLSAFLDCFAIPTPVPPHANIARSVAVK